MRGSSHGEGCQAKIRGISKRKAGWLTSSGAGVGVAPNSIKTVSVSGWSFVHAAHAGDCGAVVSTSARLRASFGYI